MQLHSQLLHHLHFPQHVFVVGAIRRNFSSDESSRVVRLLENVDVGVAESSQEGGAGERGGASPDECDFGVDYALIKRLQAGVPHLLHPHLLEHLARKLLQLADLNGPALQPVRIARGSAQLAHRAQTPAGEAEGIIGEDGLGGAVVVLILNLVDKGPDVNADRTGLLAWTVSALHAPRSLLQRLLLSVEPVVGVAGPVATEVGRGSAFEADAVVLAILLASLGVNYLGLGELRSCGEHSLGHFFGEFGECKAEQRPQDLLG